MQTKKNKTTIQVLVLGLFIAMTLACASSKGISDGITGGERGNNGSDPTSAEMIYESVDSTINTQSPNDTDLASI